MCSRVFCIPVFFRRYRSAQSPWLRIVGLCVSFLFVNGVYGQPVPDGSAEVGWSSIRHFGTRDYHAHVQNWAIVQDERGLIYAGNGAGVLEYDGVSWRLIETTGRTSVRSLAVGPDGTIYVGAHGDFGYLAPDTVGTLRYVSLRSLIAPEDADFTDIWRIVPTGDGVYFSSRERLFRLSPDGALRVWKPRTLFALGFAFRDTFYTIVPREGMKRVVGDSLESAPAGQAFVRDIIYFALPVETGAVLLASRDKGLLRYDGTRLTPFKTEADERLRKNLLYHGTVLQDGTLALATRRGGLYFVNQSGRLLRVLDETSGLRDQEIWYAFEDARGGLWLALNTGVAYIERPSSLSFYKESAGAEGIAMDIVRHRGRLYIATSQGVYALTRSPGAVPRFEPVPVPDSGQCLTLLSTEGGLLAGCEGGIYHVDSTTVHQLDRHTTRFLYRSQQEPQFVYASTREGLLRLVMENGSWSVSEMVEGLPGWVLSIGEKGDGTMWVTTTSAGVYRAAIEPAGSATTIRFGTREGLPSGWSYVTLIGGGFVFHTVGGIYRFDETRASGRFVPDTVLSALLPYPNGEVFLMAEDARGDVWFTNETDVGVLRRRGSHYAVDTTALHRLPSDAVFKIYPEQDGITWFGTVEGVYRFDGNAPVEGGLSESVQIRRVVTLEGDSLLYAGAGAPLQDIRIPFTQNSVQFTYALPVFEPYPPTEYQVRLDGFDRTWSGWSQTTTRDYTNLKAGTYVFRVRGRDAYGRVSKEGTFRIRILPPWYQTWWALLLFVAGLAGGVFALGYWGFRYWMQVLKARNAWLESVIAQRTKTLVYTNQRLRQVLDENIEFMSIAAHDLKNPVASILGFAQLLIETSPTECERTEFLRLIRESARRMHHVLEQVQGTEALEAGRIQLHTAYHNLTDQVASVVERNAAQAEAKSIRMHFERKIPVYAFYDEQYLPRVLDNLISNAIKFSCSGTEVHIYVRKEGAHAVVEIKDQGPGLTEEDRERVFGKGQRLSARPTGGESSSGLGLYIVRKLVTLHGGDVYVKSEPGSGATFGFTLPTEPEEEELVGDSCKVQRV